MTPIDYAMNTTGLSGDEIAARHARLVAAFEAFVAGFCASGEGFNGEYVGERYGGDPEVAAREAFRKWYPTREEP